MKRSTTSDVDRRRFLGLAVPACALTCAALRGVPLLADGGLSGGQAPAQGPKHKFDEELPMKPTFRQLSRVGNAQFIPLTLFLSQTMGQEKAVEMLKTFSSERVGEQVQRATQRLGGNDFAALKQLFSPEYPPWKNSLSFEVVESTDKVHELKVTECLTADTFLQAKAGAEGYAAVCFADYAFAKTFNPQIEMVRDQTLMQGHACCNHRYLWKG